MIELAFIACLYGEPSKCQDFTLTFTEEGLTPYRCVMNALPQLAQWSEAHPKYFIKKWKCLSGQHKDI